MSCRNILAAQRNLVVLPIRTGIAQSRPVIGAGLADQVGVRVPRFVNKRARRSLDVIHAVILRGSGR